MAQDIDPNNLDSIDALLDEAELDSLTEEDEFLPEDDIAEPELPDLPDIPTMDDLDAEPDFEEDAGILGAGMAEASDEEGDDDFARLLDDVVNPGASEEAVSLDGGFNQNLATEEDEAFARMLAEREQGFSNNSNELTVAEMDTLKNLIIGFSSTLIVLVLLAIGFALWAAIGVSGQNLPDETIFEEIKGEAELSRSLVQANDETLKDLNKKLDALSFQIEQVNNDLVNLGSGNVNLVQQAPVQELMPVVQEDPAPQVQAPVTSPVAPLPAQQVDSAQLAKVDSKIDALTRNLSLAQNRVVEINNRVKSLQQQYTSMLQSVKQVEKAQLEKKVAATKEPEVKAETPEVVKPASAPKDNSPYSYKAPDGGLGYDPAANSVYP